MVYSKSGPRSGRSQLTCNVCKKLCPPKEGDWFSAPEKTGQQIFLCRGCQGRLKATGPNQVR